MSDQQPTDNSKATNRHLSRRDLLRRTAVSMPAVLTLHSGAALARSSNLISASTAEYTDDAGRTLCLDVDSVYSVGTDGDVFDLGEPPYARVNAIRDRDYRAEPAGSGRVVSEAEFCRSGGPVYVQNADINNDGIIERGWSEMRTNRGALVSATALSSFAGSIQINDL